MPLLSLISSVALVTGCDPLPAGYEIPTIEITRWSEDYRSLAGVSTTLTGLDRLKWIPLSRENDIALTVGGSIREQFESYQNREFGFADGDDDVYLMHRLLLHADLRLGSQSRVFVEFGNTLIPGRDARPSPVDKNEFDITQAFLDLTPSGDGDRLRLRIGRQELPLGTGRLVALRDGPNNRLTFDAARLTLGDEHWSMDAFVAAPVDLRPGVIDDRFNDETAFWGLYGTLPSPVDDHGKIDLYYLGIDREDRVFGGASGRETRHSLGARLLGSNRGFDYNIEAVGQFGLLGGSDIRAWTVASDFGFTWEGYPWRPRLGLRANITSGDRGTDGSTETFDPLFPNNSYFSEAAILSPSNLIDINPSLTLRPSEGLELLAMWDFVWRTSEDDAAYGPPGVRLFDPADSEGRFLGHSLSLKGTYQFDRNSSLTLAYTHFFAGGAVTSAGGDDVDYFAMWFEFKF
ncbi:MAG: alginate export family protein [Planctomycetota bacterium]